MRVVHWNTHHGGVPVDSNGNDQPLNIQGITDWLIKFQPDYVSLNELEENDGYGHTEQTEYHRASLEQAQGRKWYSAFTQMSGGSTLQGIGVALLSCYPLINVVRKGLHGSRPVMFALTPFGYMFTLHAHPTSNKERNIELSQVLCLIGDKSPLIVCGDFNASPSDLELAPWSVWYTDVGKTLNRPTHGSKRIDYIWYRNLIPTSFDTPNTSANGIYPSDHHPLVAGFK